MKLKYKLCKIILILILLTSACVFFAQVPANETHRFIGIWVRKPVGTEIYDPFAPGFIMIDKIGQNYLVVVVNHVIDDDRIVARTFHHIYRAEGANLINSGTNMTSTSVLRITSNGELWEIIESPYMAEYGENYYIRPTINDFASMIELYGYKLDG